MGDGAMPGDAEALFDADLVAGAEAEDEAAGGEAFEAGGGDGGGDGVVGEGGEDGGAEGDVGGVEGRRR